MTGWNKSEREHKIVFSKRSGPTVMEVMEIRPRSNGLEIDDTTFILKDLYPEIAKVLLDEMDEQDRRDVLLSAGFREARD